MAMASVVVFSYGLVLYTVAIMIREALVSWRAVTVMTQVGLPNFAVVLSILIFLCRGRDFPRYIRGVVHII